MQTILKTTAQPGQWLRLILAVALLNGLLFLTAIGLAAAAPYRPAGDAVVVERLSLGSAANSAAAETWRRNLESNPENLQAATALARIYIAQSRAEADPRSLGYAQAALGPWWQDPNPPAVVLLLRATIRQRLHDFSGALRDLDQLLARQPHQGQAVLTKAFILQAMGRPEEAAHLCRRLPAREGGLAAATCLARMESLTGRLAAADERLTQAFAEAARTEPSLKLWALTVLAAIAQMRGNSEAAETRYQAAFALDRRNAYLMDAYADFLLDEGRGGEVPAVYEKAPVADGHLLRLALAAKANGDEKAKALIAELEARFTASHRRGDRLHLREEARLQLELLGDPEAALTLAQENWERQREPWDLRLLLAAARAAERPEAAQEALAWRDATGITSPAIDRLASDLGKAGK